LKPGGTMLHRPGTMMHRPGMLDYSEARASRAKGLAVALVLSTLLWAAILGIASALLG
jgi:hypothetical protein